MIKRILVGLGGTEFTEVAIRRSIEIARPNDAEVTGVTVMDIDRLQRVGATPVGGGGAAVQLKEHRLVMTRQRIEESIAAFEQGCRAAGIRYQVRRETGDPFELMMDESRHHDLMIFGLRSIFEYGFDVEPQDMLQQMIRQGVRPVLAVAQTYRTIRKVLVVYNGSIESARTLKRFVQLKIWPEAELEIVSFGLNDAKVNRFLKEAKEYCRQHGYRASTSWNSSPAHESILKAAEQIGADLIVLGSRANPPFVRNLLGKTTMHVLKGAQLPVFLSE